MLQVVGDGIVSISVKIIKIHMICGSVGVLVSWVRVACIKCEESTTYPFPCLLSCRAENASEKIVELRGQDVGTILDRQLLEAQSLVFEQVVIIVGARVIRKVLVKQTSGGHSFQSRNLASRRACNEHFDGDGGNAGARQVELSEVSPRTRVGRADSTAADGDGSSAI